MTMLCKTPGMDAGRGFGCSYVALMLTRLVGDLGGVCIGIAAKLFTTTGVLGPGVSMLLSPFHASCQNLVHISGCQPASTVHMSSSVPIAHSEGHVSSTGDATGNASLNHHQHSAVDVKLWMSRQCTIVKVLPGFRLDVDVAL